MGLFKTGRERRLCAFCGADHRVYMKAHISALDVVLCGLAGLLAMSPFSDSFDPRGLGLGAIFVGVAEVFVGLRHRMSVKCGRCGFDPVIYRKSQERASELVREHLAKRAQNPATLLAEPVMAAGVRSAQERRRNADSVQQP